MEEEEEEEKIKLTGSQRNMNCFLRKKIKNKVLALVISLFVFLNQKLDFIDPAGFCTSVKMKIIETSNSYITTNRHYSN
jgi:hypothetical protein